MDCVSRDSPSTLRPIGRADCPTPIPLASQEPLGDDADDPYSPGPRALPLLLGSLIALATAVVPLTTVVTGRSLTPIPPSFDGAAPSAGLPGAWAGEPGGGNPRRQPQ